MSQPDERPGAIEAMLTVAIFVVFVAWVVWLVWRPW